MMDNDLQRVQCHYSETFHWFGVHYCGFMMHFNEYTSALRYT